MFHCVRISFFPMNFYYKVIKGNLKRNWKVDNYITHSIIRLPRYSDVGAKKKFPFPAFIDL